MKIDELNRTFYSSNIRNLFESACKYSVLRNISILLENDKSSEAIYVLWEGAGAAITEANLTSSEIDNLFQTAIKSAEQSGENKTGFGKGVDIAGKAAKKGYDFSKKTIAAWKQLKSNIYNSSAMKDFADKYDKLAANLAQQYPETYSYIQKYRKLATKYPLLQKAAWGILIAATGLGGAGLTGAAVITLLKLADQTLQGKDIRDALWSATKAGATTAAVGTIKDFLGHAPTTGSAHSSSDVTTGNDYDYDYDSLNTQTNLLNNFADRMGLGSGNHHAIFKGGVPVEIDGHAVPDSMFTPEQKRMIQIAKQMSGQMQRESVEIAETVIAINEIDWTKAGQNIKNFGQNVVRGAKGQAPRHTSGKYTKPGIASKIGQVAAQAGQKASSKIKQMSHEYENVVTMKKLQTAWEKAGKPTSTEQLAKLLSYQGFNNDDVKKIFTNAGLKAPALDEPIGDQIPDNTKAEIDTLFSADLGDQNANKILQDIKSEVEQLIQSGNKDGAVTLLKNKMSELEPFANASATQPGTTAQGTATQSTPSTARLGMQTITPKTKTTSKSGTSPKPQPQPSIGRLGMQAISPTGKSASANKGKVANLSPAALALKKAKKKISEDLDMKLLVTQRILQILREHKINRQDVMLKLKPLLEFASGGSTSAGGIASYAGAGGPMMPVIRRMPAGQSFFGPAGTATPVKRKTKKKKAKHT